MKLSIEPLSQKDSRWASRKLGNSSASTIGSFGCVLICHSMMARYYGHEYLPDALNEYYKQKGVFNNDLIDFWKVKDAFPDTTPDQFIQCPDTPAPLELIDDYLNHGKPVIALVDFSAATQGLQSHSVLIIGKDNDYLINDPWKGETYYFSAKYGEPSKGIYGLRLYSGPVPQEQPSTGTTPPDSGLSERIAKVESKVDNLNEKMVDLSTNIRLNTEKMNGLSGQVDEVKKDTEQIYKDRDEIVAIKERTTMIEGKVEMSLAKQTSIETGLKADLRDLGDSFDTLEKRMKTLEAKTIGNTAFSIITKVWRYALVKLK